jgi:hypothetical protein
LAIIGVLVLAVACSDAPVTAPQAPQAVAVEGVDGEGAAKRNPRSHSAAANPTQTAGADWSVTPTCTEGGSACGNSVGLNDRVTVRAGVNRYAGTGKFKGHFTYSWSVWHDKNADGTYVKCVNLLNSTNSYGRKRLCGLLKATSNPGREGSGTSRVHWVSPESINNSPHDIRITVVVTDEAGTSKSGYYQLRYPSGS